MNKTAVDSFLTCKAMSGAINALSISQDSNSVVVAGREILKIYDIKNADIKESLNLRAGIQPNLNYASNDVKWGNNATKHTIATAAANGVITLWNINKSGSKVEREIKEHSRAVNRISFQPNNGNLLISASQDGTVKCWDLRDLRQGARSKFEGKAEAVRDVQFNPVNVHEFAAVFESGTLQKWDMRNSRPTHDRKISACFTLAHNGPCFTLDWHPNGNFIATGGRDTTIKVWDLTSDEKKPTYTIKTMSAVSRIQWRPDYPNEIASCALLTDNKIHIWDVRRPSIPKYTFEQHSSAPSGLAWHNPHELLSVAKDKWFIRQHIKGSYEQVEEMKRNPLTWNVQGDLMFSFDKSSRDLFVDESIVSNPLAGSPRNLKKLGLRSALEEVANQYIPPQSSGIVHMPLFDFEAFSILAQNYVISGEDVAVACDVNSKLAWNMRRHRTSQTWAIIGMFYSNEALETDIDESTHEDMTETDMNIEDGDDFNSVNQDGSGLHIHEDEDEDEEDVEDVEDEDEEEVSQSSDGDVESLNTSHSSFLQRSSSLFNLKIPWKHEAVVMELLDYYTDQGDVQMCVTLYLVLEKYLSIDHERVADWFIAYIDMLRRFKLWSAATAVIKACKIQSIRELNENSTTVSIACNTCFKLVNGTTGGSWACDKCHRLLNPCSLCHQTVRGLYVWCQGCNHGGHLSHMREWFAIEKLCPTGCGHTCVLQPLLSHQD
ncbi:WD40-repeat-containing domain protein [Parasitella parasitica]|nr:WD40-repeat-containing domain protein [Parasitella parasitica]